MPSSSDQNQVNNPNLPSQNPDLNVNGTNSTRTDGRVGTITGDVVGVQPRTDVNGTGWTG